MGLSALVVAIPVSPQCGGKCLTHFLEAVEARRRSITYLYDDAAASVFDWL
jgi:hypothetical protein